MSGGRELQSRGADQQKTLDGKVGRRDRERRSGGASKAVRSKPK